MVGVTVGVPVEVTVAEGLGRRVGVAVTDSVKDAAVVQAASQIVSAASKIIQ